MDMQTIIKFLERFSTGRNKLILDGDKICIFSLLVITVRMLGHCTAYLLKHRDQKSDTNSDHQSVLGEFQNRFDE